ncbi:hypothetical protein SLA2020_368540 [Shorea laevis]
MMQAVEEVAEVEEELRRERQYRVVERGREGGGRGTGGRRLWKVLGWGQNPVVGSIAGLDSVIVMVRILKVENCVVGTPSKEELKTDNEEVGCKLAFS